jgi:hypothetical protein
MACLRCLHCNEALITDVCVRVCCLPGLSGAAVASSNFDIALSVDLTGSFSEDLPIIKGLAPALWQGLAARISGERGWQNVGTSCLKLGGWSTAARQRMLPTLIAGFM